MGIAYDPYERLAEAKDRLRYAEHELAEARLEIERHHRDFERIQFLLTAPERLPNDIGLARDCIAAIRNIVG